MGLIGVGDMLNKGIAIMISRIMPVLAVRIAAVLVSLGVTFVAMRSFMESLRSIVQQAGIEAGELQQMIQELAQKSPDMLWSVIASPMLWVALAANILIFLWAQAGVYLALYPNAQSGSSGEARPLPRVLTGALGLIFPLLIINILFGLAVTVGMILLILPGVWLAVKYGFSPLLVVVEKTGATQSLSRSSELVSGYWWAIFGRLLVVGIIAVVGNVVLSFIPVVGVLVASVIFPPFLNACQLAVLESLREIKGGTVTGPA